MLTSHFSACMHSMSRYKCCTLCAYRMHLQGSAVWTKTVRIISILHIYPVPLLLHILHHFIMQKYIKHKCLIKVCPFASLLVSVLKRHPPPIGWTLVGAPWWCSSRVTGVQPFPLHCLTDMSDHTGTYGRLYSHKYKDRGRLKKWSNSLCLILRDLYFWGIFFVFRRLCKSCFSFCF